MATGNLSPSSISIASARFSTGKIIIAAISRLLLLSTILFSCGTSSESEQPAANADTLADSTVDIATDLNVDTADSEGNELLETLKLGTVTTDNTGRSEFLSITVPEDAVSFSINVVGSPGVFFAVDALRDPNDKQIVFEDWYSSPLNGKQPSVCVICMNRIASGERAHSILVPNTPAVELVPGVYSFRIYAFMQGGSVFQPEFSPAVGQAEVSAVIKRSPTGPPKFGVINMNLHFTGAGGFNASNAPTNSRLKSALKTFATIYASAGIGIGKLTYRDIDESYQVVDGFSGAGNDFETIAKLTAGNPPGINLIFVRELIAASGPGFGIILGISGGIPGPTGIQGTGRSAVFISTESPEGPGASENDLIGATMAHETGHFLGLFHSSELGFGTQQLHDHLVDTPENDLNNLMYYNSTSGGTELTESQAFVLRNNPWVEAPPNGVSP